MLSIIKTMEIRKFLKHDITKFTNDCKQGMCAYIYANESFCLEPIFCIYSFVIFF